MPPKRKYWNQVRDKFGNTRINEYRSLTKLLEYAKKYREAKANGTTTEEIRFYMFDKVKKFDYEIIPLFP